VTGGDPLAAYHDRLNATVVEALQGVSKEISDLRQEWANSSVSMDSYRKVTMQHSERIVNLELRHDRLEGRVVSVETLARGRRKTDAPFYLALQTARDIAMIAAILFVGWGLARIAATLAEMLTR
jgi:hypothetical protein